MQKTVQNGKKKLYQSPSLSQESYIIWLSYLRTMHHMTVIYVCKMIISSGFLFPFFENLVFWVCRGVKVQKMVQNGKNCTPYLRNHTSYDYVKTLIFQFVKGLKGPKKGPKCQKFLSVKLLCFFIFFKILIFWIIRGQVKG